jgi:spore germination protein YaaH
VYGLTASGRVAPQFPPGQAGAVTADIGRLRAAGLRVVPTIANVTGGKFAYQPVARVLHDPALMRQQISAIVTLVQQRGYSGIDIDYEELHAADRQAFSTYITHLADALHARGKILSVAVFAKATNAGYAPRNVAQDYAAIGRAADQVRLMAYDNHWASSPPGPVAPLGWVRSVLGYARTQIPASKIILGVPLYGYDWTGNHGTGITWQRAVALASEHSVRIRYDSASQSPWFSYTDAAGRQHQVWFENPASSAAKFRLARESGVGGVFCWMYGNEAPGTWSQLHRTLPPAHAAGKTGGAS